MTDRPLAPTPWWKRRSTVLAAAGTGAAILLYTLALSGGSRTLRVPKEQIAVGTVRSRPFREAISLPGTVEPAKTIYLTAADGGRIDQVLVAEGSAVTEGELLVRLSNPELELDTQRREDELQRALDTLRTTRLEVEESRQRAQRELLDIEHSLLVQRKELEVQSELFEEQLAPYRDLERARDEVEFWESRLALHRQAEERAERFRAAQIEQAEESVARRRRSYETAGARRSALEIRAPQSGRLTALSAEVGESKAPGERLGQVDVGGFYIEGAADQAFISRIVPGLQGSVEIDEGAGAVAHPVHVERALAEVTAGKFKVDLVFEGEPPGVLKRGQRVVSRLYLGDASERLVVPKGAFFQRTGGRWIFVLDDGGRSARRREIRLGRQDIDGYEVVSGLEAGEAVITSRYDRFGEAERLILED